MIPAVTCVCVIRDVRWGIWLILLCCFSVIGIGERASQMKFWGPLHGVAFALIFKGGCQRCVDRQISRPRIICVRKHQVRRRPQL